MANTNYKHLLEILSKINPVNQDEEEALSAARDLFQKEIPIEAEVDITYMDEDFCDYFYVCPKCGCSILEQNELTGRCDCGQSIIVPDFNDWSIEFQNTHQWNPKKEKWV